jgi:hypothetical protein
MGTGARLAAYQELESELDPLLEKFGWCEESLDDPDNILTGGEASDPDAVRGYELYASMQLLDVNATLADDHAELLKRVGMMLSGLDAVAGLADSRWYEWFDDDAGRRHWSDGRNDVAVDCARIVAAITRLLREQGYTWEKLSALLCDAHRLRIGLQQLIAGTRHND